MSTLYTLNLVAYISN